MMILRGKIFRWFLIAMFAYVIISAIRVMAAEVFSGYAKEVLTAWSTLPTQPESADVASVVRALDWATLLDPDNPDHYEDRARLALIRSTLAGYSADESKAQLAQSLEQIHRSISMRPTSSYSWATYLVIKRQLNEYDAEFCKVLDNTIMLGAWEPSVQITIAEVGMGAWGVISPSTQEVIKANLVRGMKRQAAEMVKIIFAHKTDCVGEKAKTNAACPKKVN